MTGDVAGAFVFAAVPGDEVVVSLSEDNALYLSDIERASQELP